MRIVGGVLSLLIVLAIVGWQARTQVKVAAKPVAVPTPDGAAQTLDPKQIEQQYKNALEDAMNKAHPRTSDE
jgi:hypothetical protein